MAADVGDEVVEKLLQAKQFALLLDQSMKIQMKLDWWPL
jgi:hypothetical protein